VSGEQCYKENMQTRKARSIITVVDVKKEIANLVRQGTQSSSPKAFSTIRQLTLFWILRSFKKNTGSIMLLILI